MRDTMKYKSKAEESYRRYKSANLRPEDWQATKVQ
jgi:hypothetical protein